MGRVVCLQVCKLGLRFKKKAGGGDWGEDAAPPPKQNDYTCSPVKCCRLHMVFRGVWCYFRVYLRLVAGFFRVGLGYV